MEKNKLSQKKRWLPPFFKAQYFRLLLNFYSPFLGAGIHVCSISKDFRRFEVKMKLRWYNRNFVHSHFGGSIYAMSDPFYMFILMENLGEEYIVWDKSAKIDFLKPGFSTLYAVYEIKEEELKHIQEEVNLKNKLDKYFTCEIKSDKGEIIAKVEKVLYIRKIKMRK